jgi:hypothetical protein
MPEGLRTFLDENYQHVLANAQVRPHGWLTSVSTRSCLGSYIGRRELSTRVGGDMERMEVGLPGPTCCLFVTSCKVLKGAGLGTDERV